MTILNIIDHLGKFEEKSDEGFLVRYSLNSKAFRVYNLETKRVEENLHINFLKNKPNIVGKGPNWLFDLDYLTYSMNYQPVTAENKANKTVGPKEANHNAGTQDNNDAGNSKLETEPAQEYFVLPLWSSYTSTVKSSEAKNRGEKFDGDNDSKSNGELEFAQSTKDLLLQEGAARATSTNTVNTVSTPVSTASPSRIFSTGGPYADQDDSQIPALEDIYGNPSNGIFTNASYDDEGAVADFTNLESTMNVSPIRTSRIHSIHPTTQILGDPTSAVQTRSKVNKSSRSHAFIEPKKICQALEDESWVDAMQEDLLQFKIQKVWILVDLPFRKKAFGTKWVYRNKRDERGVIVRNKLRIEAIRIFLAFASYMGFIVYQMDVKSAFLYGTIDEEVYKVVKALYGLQQAPKAWYDTLSTFLLKSGYRRGTIDNTLFIKKDKNDIMLVQVYVDDIIFGSIKKSWCDEFEALMKSRFQMSSMGELTFFLGLQVKQKEEGIFISQDKYVVEILKKFDFASMKTASTPIETQKPLVKDEEAADVDVHICQSMIGSLMYLTASRPDIMLQSVLVLGFRRLISWQCKKQTIVATSTTKAEYVAAANCRRQILDAYEKNLIKMLKIYTDDNVADLLTKAFDVSSGLLYKKLDFLLSLSLSVSPTVSTSLIEQFWNSATSKTVSNVSYIKAKVAGKVVSIYEASIRRDLLFNDVDGIDCLTNSEIFENLQLMGYEGDLTILTFQKALFSPQWKYLIHTLIHYLSSKSTSWDQFPTNIAYVMICLATDRKFNFSKMIFEGMIRNLDAKKKFLMYPTFVQVFLNNHLLNLPVSLDNFPIRVLTKKVFTNMTKKVLHFSGHVTPLFPNMLTPTVVDDSEGSEQPTEPQPTPSPTQHSTGDQHPMTESSSRHDTTQVPKVNIEGTSGSQGDQVQIPTDSPSLGGPTFDRAEGGLNLDELFVLCTNLSNRILALETFKDA
ncbi:putative ribonuclease H-like domain-containing protein [Tanacetum coccineum]